MFTIYKVTTIEDEKIYIGCTSASLDRRMSEHKYKQRCFAIMQHTIEILQKTDDFEKAQTIEAYYIEKFDSCNPEKGYNRRLGGNDYSFPEWVNAGFGKRLPASRPAELNGMFGKKHSDETKEKIRLTRLGKSSWCKGMKFSEERKQKMREARADKGYLKGENHPFFGKTKSDETKKKLSESAKGNKKWLGRKHSEESKRKMSETKRMKRLGLIQST